MTIRVLHVVTTDAGASELAVVSTEKATGETGRRQFEVSVGMKGDVPTLVFTTRIGVLKPPDIEWGPPAKRTRTWDPSKMRFR
jgi:hypothetical protein